MFRSLGKEQDRAFTELKKWLTNTKTLGHLSKDAKTRPVTDASPVGPSAVLNQVQNGEERAICFPRRSLIAKTLLTN